jgi:hypothetical protein
MSYILSLLRQIRRRPGMYIGKPSVIRLAAYIYGYEHAAEDMGGKEPDLLIHEFRDWIHQRAGSTRDSWEETILNESADDADAQERFWKLLDEFLALRGMTLSDGGAFPVLPPVTQAAVTKAG